MSSSGVIIGGVSSSGVIIGGVSSSGVIRIKLVLQKVTYVITLKNANKPS